MLNLNNQNILILILTVILSITFVFIPLDPLFKILLLLILCIFIIGFFNHKLGLFLLLLFRPCIDFSTDKVFMIIYGASINFASIVAVLTLIFAGYVIFKNIKKIKTVILLNQWILYLIVVFILSFFTINIKSGLTEFLRMFSIFSIYVLGFLLINSKQDFIKLIKIIIFSSFIPAIFAFYQFFTQTGMNFPMDGIYNRIFGTFAHPNTLAYYLIIPIILSLFLFLLNKVKNVFYIFPGICLMILLICTYCRGAWMVLLSGFFIIGIIKYRLFLISVLLILFISYLSIEQVNIRVNSLFEIDPYSSVNWRIDLWKDSINSIKQHPIIGYGTGTSQKVISQERGIKFGSTDPHNDYIRILLENGILGLTAYLFLAGLLFFNLCKQYIYSPSQSIKILSLFIISIFIAIYSAGFFDSIVRSTALQWTFWSLIGGFFAKKHLNNIKKSSSVNSQFSMIN